MAAHRIDSPSEAAMQRMHAALRDDCQAARQSCIQALIDPSCADDTLRRALTELAAKPRYLYRDHYAGEGLDRVDPWLVEMPMATPDNILALCRLCAGQPMLSFIVTTGSPDALLHHFRQQLEATDPEGDLYILRWADTRSLPALYNCFDELQQARLLRGIGTWSYFGRNGEPERIAGTATGTFSGDERVHPYRLTAAQAHALRSLARPDALLALIADHPHLYGTLTGLPSMQHLAARAALGTITEPSSTAEAVRAVVRSLELHGLLQG